MPKKTGLNTYKKFWEEQAELKNGFIWDQEKIIKLTISNEFGKNLEAIKFSKHSLKKENGK